MVLFSTIYLNPSESKFHLSDPRSYGWIDTLANWESKRRKFQVNSYPGQKFVTYYFIHLLDDDSDNQNENNECCSIVI